MSTSFTFTHIHRASAAKGWLRGEHTHEARQSVKVRQSRQRKAQSIERKERTDNQHSHRVYDAALTRSNDLQIKSEIKRLNRQVYKLSRTGANDADIEVLVNRIAELRQFC